MTTSFYAPPSAFRSGFVVLPEAEANHAARVLRHRVGDEVVVVDGDGGWHRVRLDQADRHEVSGRVLETRRDVGEPGYELTIGLALLKNRNRYEVFLEKAVELGVSAILPLVTDRTEKGGMRVSRAEGILEAAMKQSGRSRLVRLAEPTPLADVFSGEEARLGLLCHETAEAEAGLLRVIREAPGARRVCVLVGPEGGFTDEEVQAAVEAGFRVVSLGPRRLRAETAALAAAAGVHLALADSA